MRSTKLSFLFIIEGVFGVVVAFYAPAWGALLAEIGVFQCSVADFVCLREQSIVVLGAFVALFITIDCSVLLVLRYRMNKQLAQSAKGEWIQLYYDNSDKRCHHFQGPANVGEGNRYFTRIQVTNRSNAIVDRCSGRLVSILDDKHREVDNWVDSRLYWDGEVFEVSLSPNESRFLNVVWTRQGDSVFRVRIDVSTPHGIEWERPAGRYYFLIAIHANSLETVERWFRVTWNGDYRRFKMNAIEEPMSTTCNTLPEAKT